MSADWTYTRIGGNWGKTPVPLRSTLPDPVK